MTDASSRQPDPATRWRRVETLFHRAVEAPAESRSELLRGWCGADQVLFAEVLELLQADSSVEHKLATLPAPPASDADPFATPSDPWLGRTLGAYRVAHELGRGGMGVVYLGERAANSALYSQAAIKVVRRNLQHSPALGHFLLERDALARLEHPNIARLLDGGVTPEGIPFLIMEFIDGDRIDLVCDRPETSIAEVLRLIIELCGAVAYVHRNLILHRDLKPGNVMVTARTATRDGIVKLLDFGTLKLLDPEAALASAALPSAMTEAGMRPVTLRFASPEHVHGQRVSTASDVYSLGIMLYRLIAGRFPGTRPETRPDARPDPKSSEPLHYTPGSAFFDNLRQNRLEPPSAVATKPMPRDLARDLDAITMKCMRYEPGERYRTADALAAELTRALGSRPVEARGDDRSYRARKFYGRHRLALWTGLAALLVLAAGLVGARRETRVALAEQARADAGVEQERKLAHLLLFDYFEQLKQISGSTDAQKRAVSEAIIYLDHLPRSLILRDQPLQVDILRAYTSMGSVLGSPYEENLGDIDGAVKVLNRAITLGDRLLARNPGSLPLLSAEADALKTLGSVYLGNARLRLALESTQRAAAVGARIAANPHATGKDLALAGSIEDTIADIDYGSGRPSLGNPGAAREHLARSLAYDTRGASLDPQCARCRRGIAIVYWKLGSASEDVDPAAAGRFYRLSLIQDAALDPAERDGERMQRFRRIVEQHLGAVETETGHIPGGIARMQRITAEFRAASDKDPINQRDRYDIIASEQNLAGVYLEHGMSGPARDMLRKALADLGVLLKADPGSTEWLSSEASVLIELARTDGFLHDPLAAHRDRERGLALIVRLANDPDATAEALKDAASAVYELNGDPALGLRFAIRSIQLSGAPDPDQWLYLARAENRVGDRPAARAAAHKAEALFASASGFTNAERSTEAHRIGTQ